MHHATFSSQQQRRRLGFTLVELLVVIGIIALLISILLPALNSARRQSVQVKCAAQMKQMYNAFLFYGGENRNFWPAGRLQLGSTYSPGTKVYTVGGYDYPTDSSGSNASKAIYFYDFAAKYLTKTRQGNTSVTADEAEQARRSVIWACPAWEGFDGTSVGGKNRSQVGIGMNLWPTMTATDPATGVNYQADSESVYIKAFGDAGQVGQWVNSTTWGRRGAERMLLADSRLYLAEARAMPANGVFPPQPAITNNFTYTPGVAGQTTVDVYRHGKYPNLDATKAETFSQQGGKVAYNVLYCDGHVSNENSQKAAYQSLRQRFPG